MTPVTSSNIKAIGISGPNLIVEFKSGEEYIYFDAADEYESMIGSVSKGKFLNARIKPKYRVSKR